MLALITGCVVAQSGVGGGPGASSCTYELSEEVQSGIVKDPLAVVRASRAIISALSPKIEMGPRLIITLCIGRRAPVRTA